MSADVEVDRGPFTRPSVPEMIDLLLTNLRHAPTDKLMTLENAIEVELVNRFAQAAGHEEETGD